MDGPHLEAPGKSIARSGTVDSHHLLHFQLLGMGSWHSVIELLGRK